MQIKTTLPVSVSVPDLSTLNSPLSTDSYCLDFISSDATTDRYCESIDARGWKLDNYRRNPVFQNSHQYGDILFTLGKALVTEVRDVACGVPTASQLAAVPAVECGVPTVQPRLALFQRIEFACDINPMAKIAYGLYKGGFLSGVSVGFVPLKWTEPSSSRATGRDDFHVVPSSAAGGSFSREVGEGQDEGAQIVSAPAADLPIGNRKSEIENRTAPRRIYLEQELLEVSAVAIPANPNALALAYKSGAVEKADLRELSTLLSCTLSAYGVPASAGPPFKSEISNFQFLQQLHSLLRKL